MVSPDRPLISGAFIASTDIVQRIQRAGFVEFVEDDKIGTGAHVDLLWLLRPPHSGVMTQGSTISA